MAWTRAMPPRFEASLRQERPALPTATRSQSRRHCCGSATMPVDVSERSRPAMNKALAAPRLRILLPAPALLRGGESFGLLGLDAVRLLVVDHSAVFGIAA